MCFNNNSVFKSQNALAAAILPRTQLVERPRLPSSSQGEG